MLFNSYVFIFLFLPCCVIGYFLLNKLGDRWSKMFLIGMSLWFYGYNKASYLTIIVSSVIVNYVFSRLLSHLKVHKKPVLVAAIIFNLGLIFYYKYYNFTLWNINLIFHTDFVLRNIILPLGISFYTFQQVSYVIDSYHGLTREYGFTDYMLFVVFFPQLVAGPIVLHSEIIPQLRCSTSWKFSADNCYQGICLFVRGLFKKMIVADPLGVCVDWGYGNISSLGAVDVIIVMLAFCLQLYYDFSGYSDMATGIARMFNITLPVNFRSPLKSLGIVEFWKRWHITLARFFTTYVYIPLGGNRRGKLRTYLNILLVFILSGIWHGANYTFWLWGFMHGAASITERICSDRYRKIPKPVRWFLTFGFVTFALSLFRASGIRQWGSLLGQLSSNLPVCRTFMELFDIPVLDLLYRALLIRPLLQRIPVLFAALPILGIVLVTITADNNVEKVFRQDLRTAAFTALLFVWCICSLNKISAFLYFNF